jgi:hypothetical protein
MANRVLFLWDSGIQLQSIKRYMYMCRRPSTSACRLTLLHTRSSPAQIRQGKVAPSVVIKQPDVITPELPALTTQILVVTQAQIGRGRSCQKQGHVQIIKGHVQKPMQPCIDPTSKQQRSPHNQYKASWMLSQTT